MANLLDYYYPMIDRFSMASDNHVMLFCFLKSV